MKKKTMKAGYECPCVSIDEMRIEVSFCATGNTGAGWTDTVEEEDAENDF